MSYKVTFRLSALGFGGTERVFLSVADYLSSTHGCRIDFVVDKASGHETEAVALAKGYQVVSLNAARTWKTILPFSGYLKKNRPSIVFSAYTETNTAAIISKVLSGSGVPLVVTEHASLDEHWSGRSRTKKMALEMMVRFFYLLPNHVLCVSKGVMGQVKRRLKRDSISYIHNPVRYSDRSRSKVASRNAINIQPELKMILAVGRICRQKNYLMLLEALTRSPSFLSGQGCLYIVGGVYETEEKLRLDTFIAQHQLGGRIHFVDFTHEIQTYYEAADLFVLSSAWEGFGNVLVEALAVGLPVVSSNCNHGPAEILADGQFGDLVAVDDYVAMAHAIDKSLELVDQRQFDPTAQIKRAASFSESTAGQAYFELISRLLREDS